MITKLDDNMVYSTGRPNEVVMIHLSNNPTGARDSAGRMLDNIKDEGWYLFRGELGRMKPVKKLSTREALKLVNGKNI